MAFVLAAPLIAATDSGQNTTWVSGTTIPVIQLTGDTLQYNAYGKYVRTPTNSLTMTNFGLEGVDLGKPVIFPDKIVIPTGDVESTYMSGGVNYQYYAYGKSDSIGYIPLPIDLSQCNAIPSLDDQISKGKTPAPDYTNCPVFQLFTDPTYKASLNEPKFKQTQISMLGSNQGTGASEVPGGAFTLNNNNLYMFYIVQTEAAPSGGHYSIDTALVKSDQTESAWNASVAPTFTKLYDASVAPPIPDPNNPPNDATGTGKFIVAAPVVMSHATLMANHLLSGLPSNLQTAANVIFLFGSSWYFEHSNLYLAAVADTDIVTGTAKWSYLSGVNGSVPVWSSTESDALPMFSTWGSGCAQGPGCKPDIGQHSAVWSAPLQQFILMYGTVKQTTGAGNIAARTAPAPWGPWTQEASVLDHNNLWYPKFIHNSDTDKIANPADPFYQYPGGSIVGSDNRDGTAYGAGLIDQYTQNSDGSWTAYFLVSGWPPYEVFLMKTNFKPSTTAGTPQIVLTKTSSAPTAISGATVTFTIAYQNNGNGTASNLNITDLVPGGTTLVTGSITAGGTFSAGTITWIVPSIASGGSGSVSFQVKVN